jgi:hypothetical protein
MKGRTSVGSTVTDIAIVRTVIATATARLAIWAAIPVIVLYCVGEILLQAAG